MHINRIFILLAMFTLLVGCKSTQPLPSTEQYFGDTSNTISTINIPVSIDLKELERTIDQQMDGVLYEDMDMDNNNGDQLMMKATKKEAIQLEVDSQTIRYRIPIDLWIKKGFTLADVEAEGELALFFETHFDISEDWQLKTTTQLVNHQWLSKPVIKLGLIDIPIKIIADELIRRSESMISTTIDRQIQSNFKLRDYVDQAWQKIQDPILVSQAYNMWLTIKPSTLGMSPLIRKGNRIESIVVVEAFSEVYIGEHPIANIAAGLPQLNKDIKMGDDDFEIKLLSKISYEKAANIVKQEIEGVTFSSGKKSVTIDDITLFGDGGDLVVDAQLSGTYSGSLYMRGKPFYNAKKNRLEINDLDYELETKNFLQKTGAWLFPKGIEKRIEKYMRFPIEANLAEWQNLIQNKLEHYELSPNVHLSGNLDQLDINYVNLTEEDIQVVIVSKGEVDLLIRDVDKI